MRQDRIFEVIDGQNDFSGGMEMVKKPTANQYRYAENIILLDGQPETRPGIRRSFRKSAAGLLAGFYFNEGNARYTDEEHTGFWFPFQFVGTAWGSIQGVEKFRFPDEDDYRIIFVSNGSVYIQKLGFVTTIDTEESLGSGETIEFVQANEWLVMLRSGENTPMRWDGSTDGFKLFPQEIESKKIPNGDMGTYQGGRLWVRKDDNLYASDIFDINTYDYVFQLFGVNPGDGMNITTLFPWHSDNLIISKDDAIFTLSGINFASTEDAAEGIRLSDGVNIEQIISDSGIVGRYAYAEHGEQVSFVSSTGIRQISRTHQGELVGLDVTMSAPIQPIIDRINKDYLHNACVAAFKNHLLFAVPLDRSVVNDHILVFDLVLSAWVSVWKSDVINPIRFFVIEDTLYSLGADNVLRIMWTNDAVDSQHPVDDTPVWTTTEENFVGNIRRASSDAEDLYTCIQRNIGETLSSTDYWTLVTDEQSLYKITSFLKTRFYEHGDEPTPKKYSRAEVAFLHQNPSINIQYEDRGYGTISDAFSAVKTYSQEAYEINNTADWDNTNADLDFDNPGREDYTVLFDADDGIYMDADDGIDIGAWTLHGIKFIPRVVHNHEISLHITNTQGKVRIKSIVCKGQQGMFAKYGR